MQSYNLMKMSSEVTKTQAVPQYQMHELQSEYYTKPQMDFNNRGRMQPPAFEKHSSDNYLCKYIQFYFICHEVN